jgi:hypothetical protein
LTLENLSPDGKKKGKTTKESLVLLAARNCHVVYTFDFYKNVRTYRFSGVPVCEGHRPPSRHPEKAALFSLIGASRPEMFIAETLESKKCFENFSSYGILWAQMAFSSKWDTYRILLCVSPAGRFRFGSRCWPTAFRGSYRIWPTCTNWPVRFPVQDGRQRAQMEKSKSEKKIKTVNELMLKSCASLVRDGLLLPHD